MALHDFYPRPHPRPKPIDPFPKPFPPPEPAAPPFYPSPDKQDAEYLMDGIIYDGVSGKPIFNLKTGVLYY